VNAVGPGHFRTLRIAAGRDFTDRTARPRTSRSSTTLARWRVERAGQAAATDKRTDRVLLVVGVVHDGMRAGTKSQGRLSTDRSRRRPRT
jgi:hypothetical protein